MQKYSPITTRFEQLDTLRFFAFFIVFIHHVTFFNDYFNGHVLFKFITTHVLWNGHLGVNFFFVLSGFLITYLLFRETEQTHKIAVGKFYMRRFLRIWPLYFTILILGFVLVPLLMKTGEAYYPFTEMFMHIPYNTFYLYAFFLINFDVIYGVYPIPVLSVLWSVSIEEQFYLIWPWFIALLSRKHLPYLFVGIILFACAFRYYHAGDFYIVKAHTLSCMSDLATGALLAYLLFFSDKAKLFFNNLSRTAIVNGYVAGLALFAIKILIYNEPYKYSYLFWYNVYAFEPLLFSIFFAFIIAEQHYAPNSFIKLGKFKRLSELGKISYGLYCYHMFVIYVVVWASKYTGLQFGTTPSVPLFIGQMLASLFLTILLAQLSYRFIEQPFLRKRDKYRTFK